MRKIPLGFAFSVGFLLATHTIRRIGTLVHYKICLDLTPFLANNAWDKINTFENTFEGNASPLGKYFGECSTFGRGLLRRMLYLWMSTLGEYSSSGRVLLRRTLCLKVSTLGGCSTPGRLLLRRKLCLWIRILAERSSQDEASLLERIGDLPVQHASDSKALA